MNLPPAAQTKVAQLSIVHTCCAFFELAFLWYRPIERVLGKIKVVQVDATFYTSQAAKLIVAPHHGSWELLNLWLANQGELLSLYKPARTPKLDTFIRHGRSRNGAQLVPANTAGLRRLLKGLNSGACVMILPDQRPPSGTAQVQAEFFSQPAATSLLVKNLASRVDCDIFIAAATRDLAAGHYEIRLEPLNRQAFLQEDQASAQYLNSAIEQFVQPELAQYQWPYRRFDRTQYGEQHETGE